MGVMSSIMVAKAGVTPPEPDPPRAVTRGDLLAGYRPGTDIHALTSRVPMPEAPMVSRTHSRLVQVFAIALLSAALGCGGGGAPRMMRNGEDVLMAGGSAVGGLFDTRPGEAGFT